MEYKHWCGNCQIRVYVERHYGKRLSWEDCPYTCEYAVAMRCSTQNGRRRTNYCPNCGADMRESEGEDG